MLNQLAQTKTLVLTFSLTIALTACFGVVMYIWQFGIIDEMFVAGDINAHMSAMSQKQRHVHAWMSGTLDVLYPFVYAAFFIGVAIKYFGRYGPYLAIPSVLVIPADLLEGFSQVMILTGQDQWMWLKISATPVKLIFYIMGILITAVGLGIGCKRALKR